MISIQSKMGTRMSPKKESVCRTRTISRTYSEMNSDLTYSNFFIVSGLWPTIISGLWTITNQGDLFDPTLYTTTSVVGTIEPPRHNINPNRSYPITYTYTTTTT